MKIITLLLMSVCLIGCGKLPVPADQKSAYKDHRKTLIKYIKADAIKELGAQGGVAYSYLTADGEVSAGHISGVAFSALASLINDEARDNLGLCAVYVAAEKPAKPKLESCDLKLLELEEVIAVRAFMAQFVELNGANRTAIFEAMTAINLVGVEAGVVQSHLKAMEDQQAAFNDKYSSTLKELMDKLEEVSANIN